MQQVSVNVTFMRLPDVGIDDNWHFMTLKRNRDDIAVYIDGCIQNPVES